MLFLIHSKTSFSRCQTRSSQEISFTRVYYRCIHSQVISLLQVDDIWHLSNTSIDCNFNMLSTKKCPNVIDIGKLSYYSVGKLHRVCLISKRTSFLLFKYFLNPKMGKRPVVYVEGPLDIYGWFWNVVNICYSITKPVNVSRGRKAASQWLL